MTLLIRQKRWWIALAVLTAMMLPGVAYAHEGKEEPTEVAEEAETNEETPEVASVLSTLPVLGSGLDVTIERDENGVLTSVALDPASGSPVKENDHKVVFLLGDGNTEVVVKSAKGIVQTKVKADDPADVSGDGAWTGDVFGTGIVTVPYFVSFEGNNPLITVGSITGPPDVVAEAGEGRLKTSDDGDRAHYKVKVELTSGEQTAVLALKAHLKVDDDGTTRVVVAATLISNDRVDCWLGRGDDRDWKDRDGDDESADRDDEVLAARADRDDDRDDDREDRDDRWDSEDHDDDREDRDDDHWDSDDHDDDRDGDQDDSRQDHDGDDRP